MIDLHCHILPAIDDGSRSMEESLAFARSAAEEGIRVVAATPHIREGRYENSRARIEERLEELNQTLESQGIDVKVLLGAEIYLTPELVERVQSGELPSYAGEGHYFLLELPSFFMTRQVEEYVFRLRTAGITPVIAHPERNRQLMAHTEQLENLVRMGALSQLTAMSITGRFGREARKAARLLLDRGLAHLVASDAHNDRSRPLKLRRAYQTVAARWGERRAEQLFVTNPGRILNGEPVISEPPGWGDEQLARGWRARLARWLS